MFFTASNNILPRFAGLLAAFILVFVLVLSGHAALAQSTDSDSAFPVEGTTSESESTEPTDSEPTPAPSTTTLTITGNVRIATSTIETIVREAIGARATPARINRAVQDLFATEFFTDVTITPSGNGFNITVAERPSINEVRIEGNKRLESDILMEAVRSKPRQTFSPSQAEEDANAIARSYASAGRITTSVTPKIIKRSSNRVDLVFEVDEGNVSEVKKVSFIGNREFTDSRLRGIVESKQAGIFSAISKRDNFSQDKLEFDKEKLRQFYNRNGFIDFEVLSASNELTRDRGGFLIVFRVTEGQQYRFGTMKYNAQDGLDPAPYADLLSIRPGTVYNPGLINDITERILIRAGESNEPFLNPVPRLIRDDDAQLVNVEIDLSIAPPVFIERINIEGNAVTLDRVIRRQFRLVEGDAFNQYSIQKSADKIRALGYFDNVDISTRQGSGPGQIIIDVQLAEKATTGSIGFGVGYSSSEGISGTIRVQQSNLLGRGQSIGAEIRASKQANTLRFNFFEPSILDRDLSFGVEVGRSLGSSSFTPVDTDIIELRPTIGFPLGEFSRLSLGYNISRLKITPERGTRNISGTDLTTTSSVLQREAAEGPYTTSSIIVGYGLDRRNSPVRPTAGSTFAVEQELGGLGGNSKFSRTTVDYKLFRALRNDDYVFTVELSGGALFDFEKGSHIYRRFSLGGDALRGFRPYGIGPRDARTNDATGGNFYTAARFETSFPIGIPEEYGIFGGAFFDIGSVWGLDDIGTARFNGEDSKPIWRAAVGFSIFWQTAVGPLRFNFSRALRKEDYDRTESFRFTLDTRF